MRRILAVAALALLVADCTAGCKPIDPAHPSRGPMPYTSVGDGSWTAPDELKAGLWRSRDDVTAKMGCGWYATPTPTSVPPTDKHGRASVVIDGHKVKSLTTYDCGDWDWVGDR